MKNIFIESEFSSFQDFLEPAWFDHLLKKLDGSKIEADFERFALHWWGAARAFALPWLLVDGVFAASTGGKGLDGDKQKLWNEYLEINEFRGALWKTGENAYNSIYYAYETFIVSCVNSDRENPIRVTFRDFDSAVTQCFGSSLGDKIWNNNKVSLAREVRNCLVHNGGRATGNLLKMRPLPRMEGEDILVSASDTKKLYEVLKPNIELIVEHHCR